MERIYNDRISEGDEKQVHLLLFISGELALELNRETL